MGSSQSKKLQKQQQQQVKWTADRLQRDSIVAAMAANKVQRKMLLKQAKLAARNNNNYKSQHSLAAAPPAAPSRQPRAQSQQQLNNLSQANSSPLYYSPNPSQPDSAIAPMFVPSKAAPAAYLSSNQHQQHMFHETVNYPVVGGIYTNGRVGLVHNSDDDEDLACFSQEEENYENNHDDDLAGDYNNAAFNRADLYDDDDYHSQHLDHYNDRGKENLSRHGLYGRERRLARRYQQTNNNLYKHSLALEAVSIREKVRNDLATPQIAPQATALNQAKANKLNVNNNNKMRRHFNNDNNRAYRHRFQASNSNAQEEAKFLYRQNYSGSLASGVDNLEEGASAGLASPPLQASNAPLATMSSSQAQLNSMITTAQPFQQPAPTRQLSRENIAASRKAPTRHAIRSLAPGETTTQLLQQPYRIDTLEALEDRRLRKKNHLAQRKRQHHHFARPTKAQYTISKRTTNANEEAPNNIHHQQNSHSSISLTYSSQSQLSTTSSIFNINNNNTNNPALYQYNNPSTNFIPDTLYHLSENNKTNKIMHHKSATNSQLTSTTSSSFYNQLYYQAKIQKGLAYSDEERKTLNLQGLLPAAKQDLDLQIKGVVNFINNCQDELSKYIYLRNLKDFNERLFYSTLVQNVELLMPLVYTPTVGLACQRFSEIYLRPRGMFLTINDLNKLSQILNNWPEKDVRVIVVTDGERILGLGDLGANGMGISIGKLSLYTALAGIPPQNVLPITIDVGTNNEKNLNDPFYIGLRHKRIRGEKYDLLLEEFMRCVVERWGRSCLIQFEDFANSTAFNLLKRYRDKYCTFNDDIQGTASVCLSGLISANSKLLNKRLSESSYLFYGAGEANLGTANLLIMAMMEEEGDRITLEEARSKIWLVDSKGLIVSSREDLSEHKRAYAQNVTDKDQSSLSELIDIINYTKPSAIIGASAQGGAFNEEVCKRMAQINDMPIIFALSNPTSKAECTAEQAYNWTQGKCVFASGSPFEPVEYNGKTYVTGQGNNAYIFPAVGLAAIAAHVHTIPEDTFLVAAKALSDQLSEHDISIGLVYPKLNRIRDVTLKVATRVLEHFYTERLATYRPEPDDKLNFLRSIQYDCRYEAIEPISSSLGQMSLTNAATSANVNSKTTT